MAYDQRSLDDYVDVVTRIADFRERYPEGTLQPVNPAEPWRIVQAEGFDKDGTHAVHSFIVYVAAAYRTPDDPRPGIGAAWEIFPGRTPYTRGSELQNAETSAWGRAIIAVGASDAKAGIASREEVRNRQAERDAPLPICGICLHGTHEHATGVRCPVVNAGRQCGCDTYQPLPTNRDGSLSRSRTTDEQKQAAGVMTSQQQADHTALQPKRKDQSAPVVRLKADADYVCPQCGPDPRGGEVHTQEQHVWPIGPKPATPADDLFYDAPPVDEAVEDRPGTATKEQIGSMHAAFARRFDADGMQVTARVTEADAERLVASILLPLAQMNPLRWQRIFDDVRDMRRVPDDH